MIKSERTLWIIFGILFAIAMFAGVENVRRGEEFAGYAGKNSYDLYPFCLIMFMAGGIAIGILHTKLVEKYPGASFIKTETLAGIRYETAPAKKFCALWITGAIGIVEVFILPYALYGYGAALLFCVAFGVLGFLMAYWPTLWRAGTPHIFTLSPQSVQTVGHTLPVEANSVFLVGNTLRYKPFVLPTQISGQSSGDLHNNIYHAPGGNPLAAQAMAGFHNAGTGFVDAVSNMLSGMYHKYYTEMRARSWQLKFKTGSKEYILANGLDGGTLQLLLDEAALATGVAKQATNPVDQLSLNNFN